MPRPRQPLPIAAEGIRRPLARRRKIEFVIAAVTLHTDECLEAGVLPQAIGRCRGLQGGDADVCQITAQDVLQVQAAVHPAFQCDL